MLIYLIRHPEPSAARGLCYGRLDLGVDPGTLAAAATAIRAEIPERARQDAAIFTSPAARCRELARELSMAGAPSIARAPAVSSDLQELDFGAWEGLAWDAVPRLELDAWAQDIWSYRPGGGESCALAARRWRRWSLALRQTAVEVALAVTHGGLIRVALACEEILTPRNLASHPVDFGSVHRLVLEDRPACLDA